MPLLSPDMNSCSSKRVCLTGENEGVAYDPNKPCDLGMAFSLRTCDCEASYGWVYYKTESTGACYQFGADSVISCCGGSNKTTIEYRYASTWTSGPTPAFYYEANTHWGGKDVSGYLYVGQSISITPTVGATSQNKPWESPFLMGAVTATVTCSKPFFNCGAINVAGCSAKSTLSIGSYIHYPDECDCSDLDLSTTNGLTLCITRCVR